MSYSFNRISMLLFFMSCLSFNFMLFYMYSNFTTLIEFNLISLSSMDFTMCMVVDKVSLSFGFVVSFISMCVFVFASVYMKEDPFFNRFILILMSFVVSMNLLIYSGSIFQILMGWDGLGITSFALIIYYQSQDSLSAGFLTLLVNRLGDVLIVSSMVALMMLGQSSVFPFYFKNMEWFVVVLLLASLTKSAQYPFSSWLPAAMAAPTPVSALVHSSTLVTAGIYLVIRLSSNIQLSGNMCSMLCLLGSITCLLGGSAAIWEMDLKKIIALSTLSQLGVMMFSLGLNAPMLSLFHLYTHAMFKALLFLVAGMILIMSFGSQDMRLLGGVMIGSPILIMLQNISSLCLIGAPFLSAFYSKHAILEMLFMSNVNLFSLILMILATMCTSIYVARNMKILCWGKFFSPISSVLNSISFYFPLMALGLMGITYGKFFSMVNDSVTLLLYTPSLVFYILNIIVWLGVLIGIVINNMKSKSYLFSSLFFLTPLFNGSPKYCSSVFLSVKSLDNGWLEPMSWFNKMSYFFVNGIYNSFLWPGSTQYVILRGFMVIIVTMSFMMCISYI